MSREKYTEMTGAEAQSSFETLANAYFEHDRWKKELSELLALSPEGVKGWFREGKQPPYWAFVTIGALMDARAASAELESVTEAIKTLAKYT